MKLFFVIIASLLICHQSAAQLKQGQFLVGGNMNFKHDKTKDHIDSYKSNQVTIAPAVGIFVVKKLATGVAFSYNRYRSIPSSPNRTFLKTFSFDYSPFIRYYLLNEREKFNVLTQASYHFTKFTQKFEEGGSLKSRANGFSLSAGPVIFLSPQVALEFLVGYKFSERPTELGDEKTVFSSAGFQVHLGKN